VAFLQDLKQHGPADVAQQTFEALRNTRFAQTDLLTLMMGDMAPEAPQPAAALIPPGNFA